MKRSFLHEIKGSFVILLVATGLFLTPGVSRAIPAVDFTSTQNWGFGAALTIGWGFSVNEQQMVNELGYYDYGQDGLVFDHGVGLFSVSDMSLLASGTVTSGDTLDGYFRYIDVASVVLNPGELYFIAGFDPAFCAGGLNPCGPVPDPHDNVANPPFTDLVFAPQITFDGWQSESTASLQFNSYNPQTDPWANSDGPLIVANFKSTSVPEPTTFALIGLGLLGLGFARRKKTE